MSSSKKHFDLINRGEKGQSLASVLFFTICRLADIPLQAAILTPTASGLGTRLLTSLGVRTITTHASSVIPPSLLTPLTALTSNLPSWASHLATLSPTGTILLLMSAGSTAKQLYWLYISQDSFPLSAAAVVTAFNTISNTTNSLLYLALATTSLFSHPQATIGNITLPWSTIVGTALYIAGLAIEAGSERQRAIFKSRPENQGKVCKIGLWSYARHVNYLGYALWRGGYTMVSCGWIGGLTVGTWFAYDLSQRAAAVVDEYCANKYKQQWTQFKQEVPYKILPGIY
ncbi:hypothetical protein GGR50DRAFT_238042 [Xylaria sp. CBS 124048]|nr:hypothetical protein GGR50DRAFT_238042 [Xylaria sp. CBS 124048]